MVVADCDRSDVAILNCMSNGLAVGGDLKGGEHLHLSVGFVSGIGGEHGHEVIPRGATNVQM
jgi:hypothetical protein